MFDGSRAVLRAAGLAATVPSAGGTRQILQHLDLEVGERESVAILGKSGSGKSTLLSLLGLMQRPAGGTLVISGRDVSNISQSEAARLRRDLVGFVFQSYSLIGSLTVAENVALPLRYGSPISTQSMRERVNSAMHSVGIDAFAKSRPARLSGGEQQRVAIARALVTRPHVLLADEPTGALDTETGREIIELLKQTARSAGSCLVVVTHDLDVAAAMDRRLILLAGRLGPSQAETGNHT